jgi:hypothetical protein
MSKVMHKMTTPTIVAPGGSYQKALTAARF